MSAITKSPALMQALIDLNAFSISMPWASLTKFEIVELQNRFISITRSAMHSNYAREQQALMPAGPHQSPAPKGNGPFGSTYTGD